MNERTWDDIAHELRTPLTAIVAAASSLEAAPELDPETRAQLVRVILDSARRLDDAIHAAGPG